MAQATWLVHGARSRVAAAGRDVSRTLMISVAAGRSLESARRGMIQRFTAAGRGKRYSRRLALRSRCAKTTAS